MKKKNLTKRIWVDVRNIGMRMVGRACYGGRTERWGRSQGKKAVPTRQMAEAEEEAKDKKGTGHLQEKPNKSWRLESKPTTIAPA
jgi:hypothetical protein